MELTYVKDNLSVTLGETYASMSSQLGFSEEKARELGYVLTEAIYEDYVELCIPIYKQYFTLKDIVGSIHPKPVGNSVSSPHRYL